MLIILNVPKQEFTIIVSSSFWEMFALDLDSAHCDIVHTNLTVKNVVFHATANVFVKIKLPQLVFSEELIDLRITRNFRWSQLIKNRVRHIFGFVFGKVDKEGTRTYHETHECENTILIIPLIHEVGLMLWILLNFLIWQLGHIDRQFFVQWSINWFGQITKVNFLVKFSFIILGLEGLTTVKDVDTWLIGKLTCDVLQLVESGLLRKNSSIVFASLSDDLSVVLFLRDAVLIFAHSTFVFYLVNVGFGLLQLFCFCWKLLWLLWSLWWLFTTEPSGWFLLGFW